MTTEQITAEREALQVRLREAQQTTKRLYDAKQEIERSLRLEQTRGSADPDRGTVNALVTEASEIQRAYDAALTAEDRLLVKWRSFNDRHPPRRVYHRFGSPLDE